MILDHQTPWWVLAHELQKKDEEESSVSGRIVVGCSEWVQIPKAKVAPVNKHWGREQSYYQSLHESPLEICPACAWHPIFFVLLPFLLLLHLGRLVFPEALLQRYLSCLYHLTLKNSLFVFVVIYCVYILI